MPYSKIKRIWGIFMGLDNYDDTNYSTSQDKKVMKKDKAVWERKA